MPRIYFRGIFFRDPFAKAQNTILPVNLHLKILWYYARVPAQPGRPTYNLKSTNYEVKLIG